MAAVDHYPLNLLVKDRQSFSPREREYFMNPLTHVDFVVFNRITKKRCRPSKSTDTPTTRQEADRRNGTP